jgi:hypothetical protein
MLATNMSGAEEKEAARFSVASSLLELPPVIVTAAQFM